MRKARKANLIKDGNFPELETALETQMRQGMVQMRGKSLFRADVGDKSAQDIGIELLVRHRNDLIEKHLPGAE